MWIRIRIRIRNTDKEFFLKKDRQGHPTQPLANPAEFKYGNILEEFNFSTQRTEARGGGGGGYEHKVGEACSAIIFPSRIF
jgi:hypothetical protein